MLALSVCLSVCPSAFPPALASWTQDISIIPGNPLRSAALLGTHFYKQEPLSFYPVIPPHLCGHAAAWFMEERDAAALCVAHRRSRPSPWHSHTCLSPLFLKHCISFLLLLRASEHAGTLALCLSSPPLWPITT